MNSGKGRTYRIRLSNKAAKYISHLDRQNATEILDKLQTLKINPFHAKGTRALTGKLSGLYRLRIGSYRAVYEVEENNRMVIVLVIGPRGDIYKS